MEVEIVSTQTIRPAAAAGASSTPAAAERSYTLSIFDQLIPALFVPILLFYSPTDLHISAKSDILKKSLSETLTHFFPLAGKISDNLRIVADEGPAGAGIEYTEARVRGKLLSDILSPPNLEAIGQLLPAVKNSESMERLLVVRQSVFECGGMAIGICLSHKVVDAAAVYSFLKSWSATARGGSSSDMADATPYLRSASRFPPSDAFATSTCTNYPVQKNTTRRFVLSRSQVASLKAKSCSQSVANPTRVEAVVSLMWKCLISSNSKMKNNPSSSSWSSGGWQYVNLRNRINPPLPDNTFGNHLGMYKASTAVEEENIDDLSSLVSKMKRAKEEYMQDYTKKLGRDCDPGTTLNAVCESFENLLTDSSKQNGDDYFFSSVCNVDLYGSADFGWGNPIWATFYMNYTYNVVLSDTRDDEEGGIQVWVSLPKQQMDIFERDPLLLSYATPNPSINVFHQQTTSPHRTFARVSSPSFHSSQLSRPNSLSQILGRPHHRYSTRPLCNIQSRTIATTPSIRFISYFLHLHRHKLIIR